VALVDGNGQYWTDRQGRPGKVVPVYNDTNLRIDHFHAENFGDEDCRFVVLNASNVPTYQLYVPAISTPDANLAGFTRSGGGVVRDITIAGVLRMQIVAGELSAVPADWGIQFSKPAAAALPGVTVV
jgi:hypothetical protein